MRSFLRSSRFARFLVTTLLAAGCQSAPAPAPVAALPPPPTVSPDCEGQEARIAELVSQLEELRAAEEAARARNEELAAELEEKAATLAHTEESLKALEEEWRSTVQMMLRPEGGSRRIDSRPLAVSRISEVRVQLQELQESEDEEIRGRVERARELLGRADEALGNDNPAGAGFFAERAAELLRQATRVVEFRAIAGNEPLIPLLPPRTLKVVVERANLRAGPGTEHDRVATVESGTKLEADARSGDWFRVATPEGVSGWILGRLTE